MAQGEVHTVAIEVGALSNATRPLFPAPSDANGGGITVLAANVVQSASANSYLTLSKGTLASGAYTANGTVAAAIAGTASPFVANEVKAFTIGATKFVDADEWLALLEGNQGAAATVAIVTIQYVMGR